MGISFRKMRSPVRRSAFSFRIPSPAWRSRWSPDFHNNAQEASPYWGLHQALRDVARGACFADPSRPAVEACADEGESVSLLSRNLLPLGRGLAAVLLRR